MKPLKTPTLPVPSTSKSFAAPSTDPLKMSHKEWSAKLAEEMVAKLNKASSSSADEPRASQPVLPDCRQTV